MTPEAVVRAYFEHFEAGDVEAVAALFSDDAEVMAEGYDDAVGREQIERSYQQFFERAQVSCDDLSVDAVTEIGDLAIVRTHSRETITPHGAEGASSRFRELFLLRRDGEEWRVSHYMFNRPGDGS